MSGALSTLTAATTHAAADLMYLVQGATSKQIALQNLKFATRATLFMGATLNDATSAIAPIDMNTYRLAGGGVDLLCYGTVTGAVTMPFPTNLQAGDQVTVVMLQGTTGNFAISYAAGWAFVGSAPGQASPSGTRSTVMGVSDGAALAVFYNRNQRSIDPIFPELAMPALVAGVLTIDTSLGVNWVGALTANISQIVITNPIAGKAINLRWTVGGTPPYTITPGSQWSAIDGPYAPSSVVGDKFVMQGTYIAALAAFEYGAYSVLATPRIARPRVDITANTALTATGDQTFFVDATSGNVTITLPAASAWGIDNTRSQPLVIKRVDTSANTVTVQRAGSDTLETGATSIGIAPLESISLEPNFGTRWSII